MGSPASITTEPSGPYAARCDDTGKPMSTNPALTTGSGKVRLREVTVPGVGGNTVTPLGADAGWVPAFIPDTTCTAPLNGTVVMRNRSVMPDGLTPGGKASKSYRSLASAATAA